MVSVPEIILPNTSNVKQSGLLYYFTILIKRGPLLSQDDIFSKFSLF